jgi:Cu2+-exporting ATPase
LLRAVPACPRQPIQTPLTYEPASPGACFHCGLPITSGATFSAVIDGERRALCCAGCQAVAETIAGQDLTAYYRSRTALASRHESEAAGTELALYDQPEVQRDFVRDVEGAKETTLLLEGITCAACIWLNERHLAQVPGVLNAEVNYTTHRARIRWDPARIALSQILLSVEAIGYRAFPASSASAEESRKRETRAALWRLFVAGFGMMQVMMYAVPTYLADEGTMSGDIVQLMRLASFILTVPVIFYSSGPFFHGALRDLRLRRLGMDVPIALGIAVTFAASLYATLVGEGEVYYDSITMFVFFLLCGRYLELRARHKAAASLEYLDRALPVGAHRLTAYPASHDTEEVPAVALKPGDIVMVRPGEVVPADGVLLEGSTETDESLLTGESRPVAKRAGSALVAGAVNRLDAAVMQVERAGDATRASHIRRLTERAAGQRPQLVELTDRIASWFVAAVLVVAAAAWLGWAAVDPARALWIAVAVLVVTCPCALSLATPTALAVSVGALARRGVVATRGHAIEALARVTHVVFDKTGTLTHGTFDLDRVELLGDCEQGTVLGLAAALEAGSEHPIARAIIGAAGAQPAGKRVATGMRIVAGAGVEGEVEGVRYRLGTRSLVADIAGTAPFMASSRGATPVWLGSPQGWLARLSFADLLRPEAAKVIEALRTAGKNVLILSGDDADTVGEVARRLGVDAYEGGLAPERKHARVRALQEGGAVVAMVGDGVNDAPVLAQAQLSIAMGSGAVLSQAQSDLVLLSGLGGLLDAMRVSRRTMRIVGQNLAWAVAYNVVALPLAVAGLVTPWLAGIGMAASSLLVVLNALRLIEREARGERLEAGGRRAPATAAIADNPATLASRL